MAWELRCKLCGDIVGRSYTCRDSGMRGQCDLCADTVALVPQWLMRGATTLGTLDGIGHAVPCVGTAVTASGLSHATEAPPA